MEARTMPGGRFVRRGVRCFRFVRPDRRLAAFALAIALCAGAMANATYKVVKGDTLSSIARRHGTTVKDLAQANGIQNPNLIVTGRDLQIPGAGATPGAVPMAGSTTQYTVVTGDNLWRIAKKFGTSIEAIAEANGLKNRNVIRIGAVLTVPLPGPPSVETLLERYASDFQVDAALVKAIAWQESGWQQHVVSSAGAIGVMQVMPETGSFTARNLIGHDLDLSHVEHNVKAGVSFLAFLLRNTGGDETLAVAGYYQGLRSVRQNGISAQTKQYLANVMALRERFRK